MSAEGLPDDLAAVLRDQSIITPQDAKVWELLAEWQKAWSFAVGQMIEAAHEARRLRAEVERLREALRELASWQPNIASALDHLHPQHVAAIQVARALAAVPEERGA